MSESTSIGLVFEVATNNYEKSADQLHNLAKTGGFVLETIKAINDASKTQISIKVDAADATKNVNQFLSYLENTVKPNTKLNFTVNGEEVKGSLAKVSSYVREVAKEVEINFTTKGDKETIVKLKDIYTQAEKVKNTKAEVTTSVKGDAAVLTVLNNIIRDYNLVEAAQLKYTATAESTMKHYADSVGDNYRKLFTYANDYYNAVNTLAKESEMLKDRMFAEGKRRIEMQNSMELELLNKGLSARAAAGATLSKGSTETVSTLPSGYLSGLAKAQAQEQADKLNHTNTLIQYYKQEADKKRQLQDQMLADQAKYNKSHESALKMNSSMDESAFMNQLAIQERYNKAHEAALRMNHEVELRAQQAYQASMVGRLSQSAAPLPMGTQMANTNAMNTRLLAQSTPIVEPSTPRQIVPQQQSSVINELNNSLNKLQQTLMLVGVALSGRQIMDYADQWTHFTNAVGIATEKTGNAAGMQEKLFALAQNSRAPLESITTLYLRMARAGETLNMSQGQTVQMIDTVTKSLAIMGTSPTMVRGGLLQLEQALGGVTVRGQEFKSILDSMPNVMTTVAKHYMESEKAIKLESAALGGASQETLNAIKSKDAHVLSIAQLRTMMYAGQVSSEAFARAIIAGQSEIDATFAKTHKTFAQAFQTIENGFIKWVGGLNEATKASDEFYKISQKIAENFDIISKTVAAVAVALGSYALMIGLRWAAVVHPLALVASAIIGIGTAFYEMKDNLKLGDSLATWADAFDIVIGDIKSKFADLKAFFDTYVKPIFSGLGVILAAAINDIVESPIFQALRYVFEKLTGEISKYIDSVEERAIQKAGSRVELPSNVTPLSNYSSFSTKTEVPLFGLNASAPALPQQAYTSLSQLANQTTKPFGKAMEEMSPEYKETQNLQRLKEAQAKQNAADEIARQNGALVVEKTRLDYEIQRKSLGVDDNKVLQEYMNNLKAYMSVYNEGATKKVKHELELEGVLQRQNPIILTSLRNKAEELVLVDKQLAKTKEMTADLESQRKAAPTKQATFDESVGTTMGKFKDTLELQSVKSPVKISTELDTSRFTDKVKELQPIIEKASAKFNIPANIIGAIIQKESGGYNIPSSDKSSTAAGVMQINKATATTFGVKDVYNQEQAIMGAIGTLSERAAKVGLEKAIAAHNQGMGGIEKGMGYAKDVEKIAGLKQAELSQSKEVLAVYEQEKKIKSEEVKWQTLLKEGKSEEAAILEKKITSIDIPHLTHLTQEQTRQEQLNATVQSGLRAQIEEQIKLYGIIHQFDAKGETTSAKLARSTAITSLVTEKGAGALPELESSRKALEPKLISVSLMLGDIQQQIDEQKKLNTSEGETELRTERINTLLGRQSKLKDDIANTTQAMTQYARAEEQVSVKAYEALAKLQERVDTRTYKSGTREGAQAGLLAEKDKAILEVRPALSEVDKIAFDTAWEKDFKTRTMDIEIKFDNAAMVEAMSQMNNSAKLLADSFGSIGKAIGDVGVSLVTMLDLNTQNTNKAKEQEDSYKNQRSIMVEKQASSQELSKLDKDYAKQKSKLDMDSAQATIGSFANIAGAASQMFSKQSAGRKALHAVEVGLHGIEIAMSLARTVVKVAEGAASMFAQGGFAGFAGVAAMAAVMAGLGIAMAGGGSKPTEDTTHAASSEKGTVLGDIDKTSNSINNVIKALNDIHSSEYPELKATADAMRSLGGSVNSMVTKLAISTGSFTNMASAGTFTRPGQPASVNPNGSAGMQVAGVVGSAALGAVTSGGVAGMAVGAMTGMSATAAAGGVGMAAGGGIGSGAVALGGAMIGAVGGLVIAGLIYGLGKLLGIGKTKITQLGEGMVVSFSDFFGQGMEQSMTGQTWAKWELKTKGWFSDSKKIVETYGSLSSELSGSLLNVFSNLRNVISTSVAGLGLSDLLKGRMEGYTPSTLRLDWQAAKAKDQNLDIGQYISDQITAYTDRIATDIFGSLLGDFQKMGEGMLETVGRLAIEVGVVQHQFSKLGINIGAASMTTIEFSDNMISLFESTTDAKDGLKNFISVVDEFYKTVNTKGQITGQSVVDLLSFAAKKGIDDTQLLSKPILGQELKTVLTTETATSLGKAAATAALSSAAPIVKMTLGATGAFATDTDADKLLNALGSNWFSKSVSSSTDTLETAKGKLKSGITDTQWDALLSGAFANSKWGTDILAANSETLKAVKESSPAEAVSTAESYIAGTGVKGIVADISVAKEVETSANKAVAATLGLTPTIQDYFANFATPLVAMNEGILKLSGTVESTKFRERADVITTTYKGIDEGIAKFKATAEGKDFDLSKLIGLESVVAAMREAGIAGELTTTMIYNFVNAQNDADESTKSHNKSLLEQSNLVTDGRLTTAYEKRKQSYDYELSALERLHGHTGQTVEQFNTLTKAQQDSQAQGQLIIDDYIALNKSKEDAIVIGKKYETSLALQRSTMLDVALATSTFSESIKSMVDGLGEGADKTKVITDMTKTKLNEIYKSSDIAHTASVAQGKGLITDGRLTTEGEKRNIEYTTQLATMEAKNVLPADYEKLTEEAKSVALALKFTGDVAIDDFKKIHADQEDAIVIGKKYSTSLTLQQSTMSEADLSVTTFNESVKTMVNSLIDAGDKIKITADMTQTEVNKINKASQIAHTASTVAIAGIITGGEPTTDYTRRNAEFQARLDVVGEAGKITKKPGEVLSEVEKANIDASNLKIKDMQTEFTANEVGAFKRQLYTATLKKEMSTMTDAEKVKRQYVEDVKAITDVWGVGTKESVKLINLLSSAIESTKINDATKSLKDFGKSVAEWAIGLKTTQLGSTKSQLDISAAKFDYQIAALKTVGGMPTNYDTSKLSASAKSALDTYIAQTNAANVGVSVEDIKKGILSGITGNADQLITAIRNVWGSTSKEGNDLIQQVIDSVSVLPEQISPQLQMIDLLGDIKIGTDAIPASITGAALTLVTELRDRIPKIQADTTLSAETKDIAIDTVAKMIVAVEAMFASKFSNATKQATYTNVEAQAVELDVVLKSKSDPKLKDTFLKNMGFDLDGGIAIINAKIANPDDTTLTASMTTWNTAIAAKVDEIRPLIKKIESEDVNTATDALTKAIAVIKVPIPISITQSDTISAAITSLVDVKAKQDAIDKLVPKVATNNHESVGTAKTDTGAIKTNLTDIGTSIPLVKVTIDPSLATTKTALQDIFDLKNKIATGDVPVVTPTPIIPVSPSINTNTLPPNGLSTVDTTGSRRLTYDEQVTVVAPPIVEQPKSVGFSGLLDQMNARIARETAAPPVTKPDNPFGDINAVKAYIKTYQPPSYKDFMADGSFDISEVNSFLAFNGYKTFANGGAFTNGIVDRPTSFNMGLMGEAGSEAIMPLTNVGGKLGVHVIQSANDSNMNSEEELLELKKQNQILMAQNAILQEGFSQLINLNNKQNVNLEDISSTTRKQVNN